MVIFLLAGMLFWSGTGCDPAPADSSPPAVDPEEDIYDIDALGIPRFVQTQYIDLPKIWRISRFRSGVGHDYSDDFESCRSMKHYFQPKTGLDWSAISIVAPVSGIITELYPEWAGTRVALQSRQYPAFRFVLFHVQVKAGIKEGDRVEAGEALGCHIGSQTWSDIAIRVQTPRGNRLISYFDVMTDSLFQRYRARGVPSPNRFIISPDARDRDPLNCHGDQFEDAGNIANWVILY